MQTPGDAFAVLDELGRQEQVVADRQILGRVDLLLEHADEVVDVVQPVVLDIQRVAAEVRAVREQHPARARRRDVDPHSDDVVAIADIDRLCLRDLGDAGEVAVAVARAGELRPRGGDDLDRRAVVEREGAVSAGFGEPQVDQLAQLLGMLAREVVRAPARSVSTL